MIRNVQNRKFHDSYFFNLRKCLFRIFLDGHFWNHLAKSKKNPEKNDLPVFIKEFAKLRALHVYMPSCLKLLRVYMHTCPHFSRAYVPKGLRAYISFLCLSVFMAEIVSCLNALIFDLLFCYINWCMRRDNNLRTH